MCATQDRTLLVQQLMLWRCWSLRFSPIRPTALTWHQVISISFLTSRGISRGLILPQMMKWSKLWRRGSNKALLNSSLTACVNLFYVGNNIICPYRWDCGIQSPGILLTDLLQQQTCWKRDNLSAVNKKGLMQASYIWLKPPIKIVKNSNFVLIIFSLLFTRKMMKPNFVY